MFFSPTFAAVSIYFYVLWAVILSYLRVHASTIWTWFTLSFWWCKLFTHRVYYFIFIFVVVYFYFLLLMAPVSAVRPVLVPCCHAPDCTALYICCVTNKLDWIRCYFIWSDVMLSPWCVWCVSGRRWHSSESTTAERASAVLGDDNPGQPHVTGGPHPGDLGSAV